MVSSVIEVMIGSGHSNPTVEAVVEPANAPALRARSRPIRDVAFTVFFDAQRHAMVRLATLLTGSSATAEEVVQEAFVRVYERWDRLDEPAAYLRVTVVNRCNTWHRRRKTIRAHDLRHGRVEATHHDRPDEMADALAQLAARRRAVLVLRFYERLTTAEIAAAMDISETTVRSTMHRALVQLKGLLT